MARKCTSFLRGLRLYHSYSHSNPPIIDLAKPENKILSHALAKFVPTLGFSHASVDESLKDLGYTNANLETIFKFNNSTGSVVQELALCHLRERRAALLTVAENDPALPENETSRIKYLLETRLLGNRPIMHFYHQALGSMILPQNLQSSLSELHSLSDDISFYAGDKSNDFSWYSKRFALSAVFVECELFMLSDRSKDFQDTLKLMNKKVDQVDSLGYAYNSIEEWAIFNLYSTANLLKSQLIRG